MTLCGWRRRRGRGVLKSAEYVRRPQWSGPVAFERLSQTGDWDPDTLIICSYETGPYPRSRACLASPTRVLGLRYNLSKSKKTKFVAPDLSDYLHCGPLQQELWDMARRIKRNCEDLCTVPRSSVGLYFFMFWIIMIKIYRIRYLPGSVALHNKSDVQKTTPSKFINYRNFMITYQMHGIKP